MPGILRTRRGFRLGQHKDPELVEGRWVINGQKVWTSLAHCSQRWCAGPGNVYRQALLGFAASQRWTCDGEIPGNVYRQALWASWHRRLGELATPVRGASAMVGSEAAHNGHQSFGDHQLVDYEIDREQRTFLYSRAHTIYGGSNQVQRNVIGERVLGLAREPR